MYTTLRVGILAIALVGSVGCAMEDEIIEEGDEVVDIELAPDEIVDTFGGGSSHAQVCPTPPPGGSDPLVIPYSASKEGTCCWQNYVQKTYKRYLTSYLMCKL